MRCATVPTFPRVVCLKLYARFVTAMYRSRYMERAQKRRIIIHATHGRHLSVYSHGDACSVSNRMQYIVQLYLIYRTANQQRGNYWTNRMPCIKKLWGNGFKYGVLNPLRLPNRNRLYGKFVLVSYPCHMGCVSLSSYIWTDISDCATHHRSWTGNQATPAAI
jgi:hypothetical protein